jgi:tetratricopeptide (TPR) repeat protein
MNDAIARWQSLVEQQPENELARFSLGKALFDQGQFAPAKEQFLIAVTKKPDWMVAHILIGKCDQALGDQAGAKVSFELALGLAVAQHHEGPQAELEELLRELG